MRALELRRHSSRDPEADRLSEQGQALALRVGKDLPGGYSVVFVSPARRAAETVAWFLRGLGQRLPEHAVAEELTSPAEDRWRSAAKTAGTGRIDAVENVDSDLVEKESQRLADGIRRLLGSVPENGQGLAVGHSPLIEAAVYGLTGQVLEPLSECEGVLVEEDGGEVRLAREYRWETDEPSGGSDGEEDAEEIKMPLDGKDLPAFLMDVRLAAFATIGPDGKPRVRPVWFVYEDGALWFTTRLEARRTGADVAAGSPVAVSIASEDRPYRAVVAHGTPEVWTEDRDRWLERIATRYGDAEGRRWLAGALKEPDRVVMRLVPDRVLAWHYGKGDYGRMQKGASLRVKLP